MNQKVTLVGAGPGDPELLTVKALRALQSAQVVVYDRLVSAEIMALIPTGVAKIYAGKSCKHKAMPQEEINQLLVTLSKKYHRVVRLKGGDPFLFGRGGEEMLALRAANIPYEIIPGISSAQGCASIAGIPLTHRGLATGVRFITGHRMTSDDATEKLSLNWQSLADEETTIVVYMGLANLQGITEKLMAYGLSAQIPVAVIERGTTPDERLHLTDLSNVAEYVILHEVEPPSLVIIGKVVTLAENKEKMTENVTKLSYKTKA